MNLDVLKYKTIELIEHYNKDISHRKLTPISGYGDPSGNIRLYWALWSDDYKSTSQIGFMYDGEKLRPAAGSRNPVSLNDALANFQQQLDMIPLKNEITR